MEGSVRRELVTVRSGLCPGTDLQQSLLQLFSQGQLGSSLSLLLSLRVLLGFVYRGLGVSLPSGGVVVGSHLTEHSRVHPGGCQQGGVIEGSVRLGVLRLKTEQVSSPLLSGTLP